MKWPQPLQLFQKKRNKPEAGDQDGDDDVLGDLVDVVPPLDGESVPKRRSVSKDHIDSSCEKDSRNSLEIWQEARRARNSIEDRTPQARTTDTLTVCKAGFATVVNNTYVVIKHLGSGTFGRVKLCLNIRDHKLYAVKACRKSQIAQSLRHLGRRGRRNYGAGCYQSRQPRSSFDGSAGCGTHHFGKRLQAQEALAKFDLQMPTRTEELVGEIAVLKKLKHPNIVSLVEVIDDPRTDSLLLVMEYVEGGTLEPKQIGPKQWEPVAEVDVWRYVREILQGLDYLHYHKVVHGDLKPANLLWDSNGNTVKIADFSCSVTTDSMESTGCVSLSTPAFRSPESLVAGYRLSEEMDMWSLGVCIFMWIYGQLPFCGETPYAMYEKIRLEELHLPDRPAVSEDLKEFIRRLLDKRAAFRLDIHNALQHVWVTQAGHAPMNSLHGSVTSQWRHTFENLGDEMEEALRDTFTSSKLVEDVLREVSFPPGTNIVSAGEPVDRVFLIAHGQVELHQEADTPGQTGPYISGMGQLGDAQDPDMLTDVQGAPQSDSLFNMISDPHTIVQREPKIFNDVCGSFPVLGPGECLGLTFIQHHTRQHVWKANVHAKTQVVAFVAHVADLINLMKEHPETESAVKQIAVQQETDMMVAEALRQLRLSAMSRLPVCTYGS